MDTNFLIILDPEINEETGELIVVTSKLNEGDESLEILGAFTGKEAEEVINLLLRVKEE